MFLYYVSFITLRKAYIILSSKRLHHHSLHVTFASTACYFMKTNEVTTACKPLNKEMDTALLSTNIAKLRELFHFFLRMTITCTSCVKMIFLSDFSSSRDSNFRDTNDLIWISILPGEIFSVLFFNPFI